MTKEEISNLKIDLERLEKLQSEGRSYNGLKRDSLSIIHKYSLQNYDPHIKSSAYDIEEFTFDCRNIIDTQMESFNDQE